MSWEICQLDLPQSTRLPTVQLQHVLPGGSSHVDWMIDSLADRDRPLVTFELPVRIEDLEPGREYRVRRLADHRRVYLSREGLVTSGRGGHVTRLSSGTAEVADDDVEPPAVAIALRWHPSDGRVTRVQLHPLTAPSSGREDRSAAGEVWRLSVPANL